MLSIGGITYTDAWDQALAADATQLGLNAPRVATELGVGIEIDYEQNSSPNLVGLQAFIDAYRSVHPYDASGAEPAARLTIDLAAGDRWLIALTQKATADWLRTDAPVLDYANAMVPARQPRSAAEAQANWQEHIDGKPKYAPPIPPLAPAKFTGGLYVALGAKPLPECKSFATSLQKSTSELRPERRAQGGGHDGRHAGLHVLGCGEAVDPEYRDRAAQHLRRGRGRRCHHLRHPGAVGDPAPDLTPSASGHTHPRSIGPIG